MTENNSIFETVFDEITTPYQYGVVLRPSGIAGAPDSDAVDCPTVFEHDGRFYMTYVCHNGQGYNTGIAVSDDLLNWEKLGVILDMGKSGCWDEFNAAGFPICEYKWGEIPRLHKRDGYFYMPYIGSNEPGYECGVISMGMSRSRSLLTGWERITDEPVMRPEMPYEGIKLWKQFVIFDGEKYIDYYNAGSAPEQICTAFSHDLLNWTRHDNNPIIGTTQTNEGMWGQHISGDPNNIQKICGVWVMFYFTDTPDGFLDSFAVSDDLLNWKKSHIPLTNRNNGYDSTYAHKPCVIKHKETVYHYYCATGSEGRVIALKHGARGYAAF